MTSRTTFGDKAATAHTLSFTLRPAGHDSLELETGEVFERNADEQKEISASLYVRPASDESDPLHMSYDESDPLHMSYIAAGKGDDFRAGSPPMIQFGVSVPASDYSLLLNNIRAGIMPSAVTVGLRHDYRDKGSPMKYVGGSGRRLFWHNSAPKNIHVDVESIDFQYRLIGEDFTDGEFVKPATAKASIDAASDAIVSMLDDLGKAVVKGNNSIVTAIIIAWSLACAVLYFARH